MTRRIAWKHFYPEGNGHPKPGYQLHHTDVTLKLRDPKRYNDYRIEDVVMITEEEHKSIHKKSKTGWFATSYKKYENSREKAWMYFYPEGCGKAKPGYELHHKDPYLFSKDPERYKNFFVEDLIMLTTKEHKQIHKETKTGIFSEESNKKLKNSMIDYFSVPENRLKNKMEQKRNHNTDKFRLKQREILLKYYEEHPEYKQKLKEAHSRLKWWNNGVISKQSEFCPGEDFSRGRLPYSVNKKQANKLK